MPTIHVHGSNGYEYTYRTRGRGKSVLPALMAMVRDAGSLRTMYDDLARRMALCAIETKKHGRTGDDLAAGNQEGHQFYGNQHTGGIGGLPKHAHIEKVQMALVSQEIKSLKLAVHKLLSSGHPFSKEELAEAVGMDPKGKTINDYLTNLKNPKFAGPQGALKIEKNKDGHFFVAMPDGSQAPPPDTKLDLSKGHDPTTAAAMQKLIAQPSAFKDPDDFGPGKDDPMWQTAKIEAPPPAPVAAPHAPEPSYDPVAHDIGVSAIVQLSTAAPGSVNKQKADDLYNEAKYDAVQELKDSIMNAKDLTASALAFKNAQSTAMAAWAMAVQGVPFKPTKHEKVFQADWQLITDLQEGMGNVSAHIKWKKNTAAEKAGTWPPKEGAAEALNKASATFAASQAAKKASPLPTPAPVAAPMPAAVPVKPIDYHKMRPNGFADIDEDDILSGKFKKGILSLKKQLEKESVNSATNKKGVEQRLRARLADAPNFQALRKRFSHMAKEGPGSLESRLIQTWAGSSGDSNDLSVAMQMAVRDAFTIPDDHIETKALHSLESHSHDVDKLTISAMSALSGYSGPKITPDEVATARGALQEFVHAQYQETQEHLKELGHDHVFLARGMKFMVKHDYTAPAAVKLQPASSFSTNVATAQGFSGGSTVFITKVPREQVLSTYITGFGCTGEHEVVVMAHEKMKAYTMPGASYLASSATAAQAHMQSAIKAANPALKNAKTAPEDYGDE